MKTLFVLFFLFFITSIYSQERYTFTIWEYPPGTSKHLPDYGFFTKIVTEAFKAVDVEVEYVFYPWVRGYRKVLRGEVHGSLGYLKTKEREEEMLFSDDIWSGSYGMAFYLIDKNIKIDKPEDLIPYRVLIQRGYTYGEETDHLLRMGIIEHDIIEREEQAFKMLISGRADIFLSNSPDGLHTIENDFPGYIGKITYTEFDETLADINYHVIISRELSNGEEIISKFNKGLIIIKESGLYNKIIERQ